MEIVYQALQYTISAFMCVITAKLVVILIPKDSVFVNILAILFTSSPFLHLLIYFYISKKISTANCQIKLKCESNKTGEMVEITYAEYDKEKLVEMTRSSAFLCAFFSMFFSRLGADVGLSLFASSIVKNLMFSPICKIYIFGSAVERPFRTNSLFVKSKVATFAENKND